MKNHCKILSVSRNFFSYASNTLKLNIKYFLVINRIIYKKNYFARYFKFAAIIYLIGIFGLLIADVYYRDDQGRAMFGFVGYLNESRVISEYGSYLLGMRDYKTRLIADASPLFQMMAAIVLAFGSVILVKVVSGNLSYWSIIASLPLGLSPYFLSNLSYKFDSHFMALSVVAPIIPFLYVRRLSLFALISIPALLVMFTTYQSSHAIYILLVLFIALCGLNEIQGFKSMTLKKASKFITCGAVSYITAALIFFGVVYNPDVGYKGGASLFSLNISTLVRNMFLYAKLIKEDISGTIFEDLCWLVATFFILNFIIKSKGHKYGLRAFCSSIFFVLAGGFVAYGIYFFLESPFFRARAFCGFGVFIAIMSIFISNGMFAEKILVLLLGYNLIVTSYVYANSLSAQHAYSTFRRDMMIVDLLKVLPSDTTDDAISVHVRSPEIKPHPATENSIKYFPLLRRINFEYLGENIWFTQAQFRDVRFDYMAQDEYWKTRLLGDGKWKGYIPGKDERKCNGEEKAVYHNRLNTIKEFSGNCFEIYFEAGKNEKH